eukprot:1335258-Prorocentrum_lima.AAC.1
MVSGISSVAVCTSSIMGCSCTLSWRESGVLRTVMVPPASNGRHCLRLTMAASHKIASLRGCG